MPLFVLIGFSFQPGQGMEGVLRWEDAVRWMESALPLLQHGVALIVYYWVAALLPALFFRRMHPVVGSALKISSLLTAGVCWWQSLIVTYHLMGWFAVVMGLFFAGVGVVPMAILASAAKGQWDTFGNLMATLGLTLLARILARIIANRVARVRIPRIARTYVADDYDT
jgi:uncharacterized membrane protein